MLGISGASGGTFNALAAWYGLVTADKARAIDLLDAIWEDLSAPDLSDRVMNNFVVGLSRLGSTGVPLFQLSPYDIPGSELGVIERVNEWIDEGHLPESEFSKTKIRRLPMGKTYHCSTKVDRSPSFIQGLMELGEQRAAEFHETW